MTQETAVWEAIEELGTRTRVAVLQERAEKFYGGEIHYKTVTKARRAWRRANKENIDCRTYEGQPRRNMLDDCKVEIEQVRALQLFSKGNPKTLRSLQQLLTKFHSKDHIENSIQTLDGFQYGSEAA